MNENTQDQSTEVGWRSHGKEGTQKHKTDMDRVACREEDESGRGAQARLPSVANKKRRHLATIEFQMHSACFLSVSQSSASSGCSVHRNPQLPLECKVF